MNLKQLQRADNEPENTNLQKVDFEPENTVRKPTTPSESRQLT
jgi:hypothetical protein